MSRTSNEVPLVCFEPDDGSITRFRCDGGTLALVSLGQARKTLVL